MPVDNNEHQRIDDISTERTISYGIQSLETMGFALSCMNCLTVLSKRHNDRILVVTCRCEMHDLAMF